jgi:hypothetical protein
MKKFNADGGFRNDVRQEINKNDLNNYNGQSLKEVKEELDDTIYLSPEKIEEISDRYNKEEEPVDDDIERSSQTGRPERMR